ncbi:MAG TPA: hypothetical protein VGE47_18170 [Burkholderiaceae bacterium]
MKQVDLEPSEYTVKGGKEPILQRGWWKGILLFVVIVLMGMYVVPPVHAFFGDVLTALGWK